MDNNSIPKSVRQWYSSIGKRGVAGRLRKLSATEREKIARAGGLARQAKLRADAEAARLSGTTNADK